MNDERMDREGAALVLVDYQQRLMPSIAGGEAAVAQALFLAAVARRLGIAVIGTEQNPQGLGPNVEAVRAACDDTMGKHHFDACEDGLLDALPAGGPVVIAGCEAHVCLLQTALGLRRVGRRVFVVAEACGSRRPADHALAMRRLEQSGAAIVNAEMVAFEWLHSCRDAGFKDVLELIKRRPV